jgi:hypothetical protein
MENRKSGKTGLFIKNRQRKYHTTGLSNIMYPKGNSESCWGCCRVSVRICLTLERERSRLWLSISSLQHIHKCREAYPLVYICPHKSPLTTASAGRGGNDVWSIRESPGLVET